MKTDITAKDIYSYIVSSYTSKDAEEYNALLRVIEILNLCDSLECRKFSRKDDGAVNSKFTAKYVPIQSFPTISCVNVHRVDNNIKFFLEIYFSKELLLTISIVQQEKLSIMASWMKVFSNSVSALETFIPQNDFEHLDEKIKLFLIKNMSILTSNIKNH